MQNKAKTLGVEVVVLPDGIVRLFGVGAQGNSSIDLKTRTSGWPEVATDYDGATYQMDGWNLDIGLTDEDTVYIQTYRSGEQYNPIQYLEYTDKGWLE